MSLFGKDNGKKHTDKMKTFEVKLAGTRTAKAKKGGSSPKKALSFTEWIEQYVKASKGNVV